MTSLDIIKEFFDKAKVKYDELIHQDGTVMKVSGEATISGKEVIAYFNSNGELIGHETVT